MSWVAETRTSYDTVAENYQPMVWAMFDVANLTVSATARTGPPGADQCCLLFRRPA